MNVRVGVFVLLVLGASWACYARELSTSEKNYVISGFSEVNYEKSRRQAEVRQAVKNDEMCTMCEEYVSQALNYLAENKTQMEVIEALHKSCSKLHSLNQQCITLVDYYAPLFFLQISQVQPRDFCQKMNLCEKTAITSQPLYQDSCGFCHRAVAEVILKLKDPDTQLEIIEVLLKGCNSMENYVKKCKRMVFEYGPLILANAEKFLETTDICTMLHACDSDLASATIGQSLSSPIDTSLVSAS